MMLHLIFKYHLKYALHIVMFTTEAFKHFIEYNDVRLRETNS